METNCCTSTVNTTTNMESAAVASDGSQLTMPTETVSQSQSQPQLQSQSKMILAEKAKTRTMPTKKPAVSGHSKSSTGMRSGTVSTILTAAGSAASSVPCRSLKEIETLQKNNLISAIKELQLVEEKRMARLDAVKSRKDKITLEKRYETERQLDANKIERLKADYVSVRSKIDAGEYTSREENCGSTVRGPEKLPECAPRFHGLDKAEEIVSSISCRF
jgi:hypothetical protein